MKYLRDTYKEVQAFKRFITLKEYIMIILTEGSIDLLIDFEDQITFCGMFYDIHEVEQYLFKKGFRYVRFNKYDEDLAIPYIRIFI